MSNIPVEIKRAQQTLLLARMSNELSRRFQGQLQKQAAVRKNVNALVPGVLEALIDNDRINVQSKEAVAAAIKDHAKCLELLEAVARHKNAAEISPFGKAVDATKLSKQASTSSQLVGRRIADYDKTEAGQAFKDILYGRMS